MSPATSLFFMLKILYTLYHKTTKKIIFVILNKVELYTWVQLMPKIVANTNTVLKKADKDSKELAPNEVFPMGSGNAIAGEILPGKGQSFGVKLAGNAGSLKAGETWYIYGPHFEMGGVQGLITPKVDAKSVKLSAVPYFSQNDSSTGTGYRECNATSCTMLVASLVPDFVKNAKANGFSQPESYYLSKLDRYGDTTSHEAHTECLRKEFGIESYFSYTGSPADLYSQLKLGIPTVLGVAYKASGHMILCVGYEENGYFIHDPHGVRNSTRDEYLIYSTDQDKAGAFDRYSQDAMDAILWDMAQDAKKECGWMRFVVSVNGKPTGVKPGL